MNKILLVEDDLSLSLGIEFTLKDEGYLVSRAVTFKEGETLLNTEKFDMVILDINLPDGSGYDLCSIIRSKSDVPVIFLTALEEEVNVVLGLEMGGDDYITKPFRVKELLSRIKAILRRNSINSISGNILKSGDITVNTLTAIVKKGEDDLALTAQEYKLLLVFMGKPHAQMKRDEILSELTDSMEVFFDENTLSVYINRIREKVEDNPKEPEFIVTQRGVGYKWNKDVFKE